MSMLSAPLRFPILVIGGWIGARAAFLLPGLAGIGGGAAVAVTTLTLAPLVMDRVERPMLPAPATNVTVALDPPAATRPGEIMIALDEPLAPAAPGEWRLASYEVIPAPPPSVPRPTRAEPGFTNMPPARSSRWSGSAWLFARPTPGARDWPAEASSAARRRG
jgi:hypothetical protein